MSRYILDSFSSRDLTIAFGTAFSSPIHFQSTLRVVCTAAAGKIFVELDKLATTRRRAKDGRGREEKADGRIHACARGRRATTGAEGHVINDVMAQLSAAISDAMSPRLPSQTHESFVRFLIHGLRLSYLLFSFF